MKRIRILSVCLLLAGVMMAGCSRPPKNGFIPADHRHFQFTGRIDYSEPHAPVFYWPGTYVKTKFEGTSLRVVLDDQKGDNFYSAFIDKNWDTPYIIDCDSGRFTYDVVAGLADTIHQLLLFRRTEGFSGWTKFLGLQLDSGKTVQEPDTRPDRLIEFYGNSITCGMGNECPDDSTDKDNAGRNNFLAYGAITARNLDADYICIAKSGIGIVKSWFPLVMGEYYDRLNPTDPESHWDFSQWQPDVVVINLFQNDSWLVPKMNPQPTEQEIIEAYARFVRTIRGHYPQTTIVCTLGSMDATRAGSPWPGYIQQAVAQLKQQSGDTQLYTLFFPNDGWLKHPRVRHHQQMANQLTVFLRQIMHWE